MKFDQAQYTRPSFNEISEKMANLTEIVVNAKNAQECFAVYKEIDECKNFVEAMFSLVFVRNALNSTDEFYSKEKEYTDELKPKLEVLWQKVNEHLINSPHRGELERAWGNLMFANTELKLKTFSPEVVKYAQEESKLATKYNTLMARAQIEFDGKTLNLSQIMPYRESPDREIRKGATLAFANWFKSNHERLDSLFDELVQVRTSLAQKLGHETFTPVGYYRMQRNCYNEKMVSSFREGVLKHIVPIAKQIKEAQAKNIAVDKLMIYDDLIKYLDGNATPKGTPEEILAKGKVMYRELSPETAEFFDFMLDNGLLDVTTRLGKATGGFCEAMPYFKAPFVFANFNGTSNDIRVLTHEVGHAFASYAGRNIYPTALQEFSNETAEVHSMAMEFFTWPWMEMFFGEQTQKYYESHLANALTFIPYGVMVDEFQHHIYANPHMTPTERNTLWLKLESMYRPWLDMGDTPFFAEGRLWQSQRHIYLVPFYYIDYCLAQVMALNFWALSQNDRLDSWEKYKRFVGFAGTKTFVDLVGDSDLPSPFVSDNLKLISDAAMLWFAKKQ